MTPSEGVGLVLRVEIFKGGAGRDLIDGVSSYLKGC